MGHLSAIAIAKVNSGMRYVNIKALESHHLLYYFYVLLLVVGHPDKLKIGVDPLALQLVLLRSVYS